MRVSSRPPSDRIAASDWLGADLQRILEPDEIQALDRSAIPRVRLPQRRELFAARAQRLRELAGDSHPIGAYLRLMAELVQAQHETLAQYHAQLPAPQTMVLAQQHGMPIVPANSGTRDPLWRDVLAALLARLEAQGELAPALATVFARLRALDVAALERQADALLGAVSAAPAWQGTEALDTALAPFIWAALQVMWTAWASTIAAEQVPYLETASLCPVCGSHPGSQRGQGGRRVPGIPFHRVRPVRHRSARGAREVHAVRFDPGDCLPGHRRRGRGPQGRDLRGVP